LSNEAVAAGSGQNFHRNVPRGTSAKMRSGATRRSTWKAARRSTWNMNAGSLCPGVQSIPEEASCGDGHPTPSWTSKAWFYRMLVDPHAEASRCRDLFPKMSVPRGTFLSSLLLSVKIATTNHLHRNRAGAVKAIHH